MKTAIVPEIATASISMTARGLNSSSFVNKAVWTMPKDEMKKVEAYSHYIRMVKLGDSELNRVNSQLGCVYSNGETNIFVKYSHTTNQVAMA
jgi:esterase/lipase superfamily enzyme